MIIAFNLLVFFYFAAINTVYLVLFSAAFVGSIKYNRRRRFIDFNEVFRSPLTPSISVLVPAYNEESTIVESVRAILLLRYPHFEVVVVNDGSSDRTLELLGERYNLRRIAKFVPDRVPCEPIRGVFVSSDHDNLVVVDKENGGKADALNAGINVSRHDLVCVIDADSLIEPEGLLKVARPFIENPSTTVAVGGLVRIINGCTVESGTVTQVRLPRNPIANLQTVEYLRAFLGGRIGWSTLRSLLIISGAFGLFDRRLAIAVDGYRRDTVGEDMDLIVRMHRYLRREKRKYRIFFVPDPVCWTEAPEKIRQLGKQRDRWQRGLIETLTANLGMLVNPRYGPIGLVAMPYFFLFEMIGPAIELTGYVFIVLALVLGLLNVQFLYLFLALAFGYAIAVSLFAVLLEGIALQHYPRVPALLKLAFYSVAENIGYRQINAWWRTKAFFTLFTRKQSWGAMERRGYADDAEWKEAPSAGPLPRVERRTVGRRGARGLLVPVVAVVVAVLLVLVVAWAVVSVTRVDRRARPEPVARMGGLDVAVMARGRYFEVYDGKAWKEFLVRGVDVGIALPGRWFSEFPEDDRLYRSWFERISALGANTIRVYTLLDPVFYRTLYDFNRASENKLMLLQEIWPDDVVPGDNLYDRGYTAAYRREIAVDLEALAGKRSIPERKGRAWGDYDADVTPYLLGVIIGREIVYEEASTTNASNANRGDFSGRYVSSVGGANAVESWMAETCDYTVQRMEEAGWAAPVAFVSWPTLDPMSHRTEATPGTPRSEEHEDSEVLDPNHIVPGGDTVAGLFGCYHIYPYYPDFMNREPEYAEYHDESGVLRYGGYLRSFMSVHPEYPALVGEFGMSTSMGVAHVHPEQFNHGGVDEEQQGELISRMYDAIIREGYAGGAVFEWADEWSKRTWVDMDYMIPFDRHIYWHNMMDPEQCFGVLAYDPGSTAEKDSVPYWKSKDAPGGGAAVIEGIGVSHDDGFLYLELDLGGSYGKELVPGADSDLQLDVGIDTIGDDSGTVRLPMEGLPDLPGGVEFLLTVNAKDGALLLARPDYNRGDTRFMAAHATDPDFVHVRLMTNREQVDSVDGTVFPSEYVDDSLLRYGVFLPSSREYYSLAHWYVSDDGKKVFIRLPWLLLNVSDPSSLTVIHDDRTDLPAGPAAVRTELGENALHTQKTEGFAFYAVITRGGKPSDFQPRRGTSWARTRRFTWQGWDAPTYRERLKKSYPEIQELFRRYPDD
ncbi:MAG: glycosyltransferase [Actinobacteria bacterium]|nr:glycosyltransferase [Actinomycetota bacterium]MBU1943771.1 glycosyltransferase [Actinomycetota bacterium]MBU2688795.1 glycosyltransferase [Actinomycetota bacterium]